MLIHFHKLGVISTFFENRQIFVFIDILFKIVLDWLYFALHVMEITRYAHQLHYSYNKLSLDHIILKKVDNK